MRKNNKNNNIITMKSKHIDRTTSTPKAPRKKAKKITKLNKELVTPSRLIKISDMLAFNKARKNYESTGIDAMNPYNPANEENIKELAGDCLAGLYEHMHDNHWTDKEYKLKLTNKEMHELCKAGYRAMNDSRRRMRQDHFNHLYIEVYRDDKSKTFDIYNVTKEIDRFKESYDELLNAIWYTLNEQEKDIIQRHAKGHMDETIARELGCSRQYVNKVRHEVKKRAVSILNTNNFNC